MAQSSSRAGATAPSPIADATAASAGSRQETGGWEERAAAADLLLPGRRVSGPGQARGCTHIPPPPCLESTTSSGYSINIQAQNDSLKVYSGEEELRTFRAMIPVERGGPRLSTNEREFCGACGSFLWGHDPSWPQWIYPFAGAHVAAAHMRDWWVACCQGWGASACGSAATWAVTSTGRSVPCLLHAPWPGCQPARCTSQSSGC